MVLRRRMDLLALTRLVAATRKPEGVASDDMDAPSDVDIPTQSPVTTERTDSPRGDRAPAGPDGTLPAAPQGAREGDKMIECRTILCFASGYEAPPPASTT